MLKNADGEEIHVLLTGVTQSLKGMINELSSNIAKSISSIQFPVIQIPKIEFPKLNIPKIDFEEFYREFEEECRSNAKHGWALPSGMSFPKYRSIGRAEDNTEVRDMLFKKEFEINDRELYKYEKSFIIENSSEEWRSFYQTCFEAVEQERFILAVPALLVAVEHELSYDFDSDKVGKKLLKDVELALFDSTELDEFSHIVGASLISLLSNAIFGRDDFNGDRPPIINRNRVLHGRDNPSNWSIIDVYKLMTVISTVKFLQE
jgi:hypothetical protein